MRGNRMVIALVMALVAAALTLAACGDGGDDETTTSPAPAAESPSGGVAPPSAGALPPQLLECFADRGYEIESPDAIHQAPQQVVDECFGQLHEGGAGP